MIEGVDVHALGPGRGRRATPPARGRSETLSERGSGTTLRGRETQRVAISQMETKEKSIWPTPTQTGSGETRSPDRPRQAETKSFLSGAAVRHIKREEKRDISIERAERKKEHRINK